MKFILMLVIFAAWAGVFVLVQLGAAWVYDGQGLHPAVCTVGVLALVTLGWICAALIEDME